MSKHHIIALMAVFAVLAAPAVSAQALQPQQTTEEAEAPQAPGKLKQLWRATGGKAVGAGKKFVGTTTDIVRGRGWFKTYATDADNVVFLTRGNEHWQCMSTAVLQRRGQEVQIDNSSFKDGEVCRQGKEQLADATARANAMMPDLTRKAEAFVAGREFIALNETDGSYTREKDFTRWRCAVVQPFTEDKQRPLVDTKAHFGPGGNCQPAAK